MGHYITAEVTTEVDVYLDDLDVDDLIEFLQDKGYTIHHPDLVPEPEPQESAQLIATIYHKRRCGHDVEAELDRLIYVVLGRII